MTAPLTDCMCTGKFVWTEEANRVFMLIKELLTIAPILVLPDFTIPFELHCDASKIGIGAVLTLKHLNSQDKLSSRHAWWAAYIQQFSFVLKHKSGHLNKVEDALSRRITLVTTLRTSVLGFELLKDLLPTDPYFGTILRELSTRSGSYFILHEGYLFKGTRLCVPEISLRLQIIRVLRSEGHVGHDKTLNLVAFVTTQKWAT
ncbi:uncharacterized protein LOC120012463 [Tripterygium wilfordii]|uniref:uncharacterized protein LOC120012463 n=1 Tax=Tripterygium wilfordii TaxID=458696 RepID=UPI0018F83EA0|nr:uncharacterized protein LOC120012463 [Tripterygium wilfordii]